MVVILAGARASLRSTFAIARASLRSTIAIARRSVASLYSVSLTLGPRFARCSLRANDVQGNSPSSGGLLSYNERRCDRSPI